MSNCANCKHWSRNDPPRPDQDQSLRDRYPQSHDPAWGQCELAAYDHEYAHPESKALVADQDAHVWLNTHETFGCVQFEAGDACQAGQDSTSPRKA